MGFLETKGSMKMLVTQNVDGLHQQAGSSPELIVEVHGSLRESECLECGHREPMEVTIANLANDDAEPRCSKCSGGPVKVIFSCMQGWSRSFRRAVARACNGERN